MVDLPSVILAFMAGVFTVFAPCSFLLLPGYFAYRLTISSSRRRTILEGLLCALGLISVFCILALLLSFAGAFLSSYITLMPPMAGVFIIIMGIVTLAGWRLPYPAFSTRVTRRSGLLGTFGYGVAYGFATTGCSAPVFYSLVVYSLASKTLVEGAIVFSAYSFGIGLPLVAVSALIGFGRGALLKKFSRVTPLLHRIAGVLLVGFGLYQIYRYVSTF